MTVKELKAALNALPDGTEDYEMVICYDWEWIDGLTRDSRVQRIPMDNSIYPDPRTGTVEIS